jgi:hypothetical protein
MRPFRILICACLFFVLPGPRPLGARQSSTHQTQNPASSHYLVDISQQASTSAATASTGSYLIEIITLKPAAKASGKSPLAPQAKKVQKISFAPIADHFNGDKEDKEFEITASSDSGLDVSLKVVSGPATISGKKVTLTGSGSVTIEAEQEGNDQYVPACGSRTFHVWPNRSVCILGLVPQSDSPGDCQKASSDLSHVLSLLGNPAPFSVQTDGKDTILIYSSKSPLSKEDTAELEKIKELIPKLAGRDVETSKESKPTPDALAGFVSKQTAKPTSAGYSLELKIPHAGALGDLATKLGSIDPTAFTIQDVGADKIRITSPTMPDCPRLTTFLEDIRDLVWSPQQQSPVYKVFYLNAPDVSAALGGGGGSSQGGPSSSGNPGGGQGGTPGPSGQQQGGGTPNSGTNPPAANTQTGGQTAAPAGNPTPSSSSANPAGGTQSTPAGNTTGAPTPKAGGGGPTPTPASAGVSVTPVSTDGLVFSDALPGDDAGIIEKKRTIAQLDLPRPVVELTAWSLQTSSSESKDVAQVKRELEETVSIHNGGIQSSIEAGWSAIKKELDSQGEKFFYPLFYDYVTNRFIAKRGVPEGAPQPDNSQFGAQQRAQAIIELRDLNGGKSDPLDERRKQLHACEESRYCLGYTALFQPLKPRLTDLLLALIAANDPKKVLTDTLPSVERAGKTPPPAGPDLAAEVEKSVRRKAKMEALMTDLGFDRNELTEVLSERVYDPSAQAVSCVRQDLVGLLQAHAAGFQEPASKPEPPEPLQAECFRTAFLSYVDAEGSTGQTKLNLLRAALADFLFNYKRSQQYPHEFDPYFLTQSADALNSQLLPIVAAFNQDILTYQTFLRSEVQVKQAKENWGDEAVGWQKSNFVNNAVVSVNTLGSVDTIVDTISQSNLDVTQPPSFSDLVNSLNAVEGTPSGGSNIPKVISSNITPNQAQLILGALGSIKPTGAQIGRELKIEFTARTLSNASTAEVTVTMNVGESGTPTLYSGGQSSNDNFSRVATHNITTKVRVDSIRLFEISSFSAELQRSRTRIPLIPPFVEMPYIGSLVGIPRRPGMEFHNSSAILSVVVVPTAADIAYGLAFVDDRLLWDIPPKGCGGDKQALCKARLPLAMSDFGDKNIVSFHVAMLNCLATGNKSSVTGVFPSGNTDDSFCTNPNFEAIPH